MLDDDRACRAREPRANEVPDGRGAFVAVPQGYCDRCSPFAAEAHH
ncbi:MAG: hypothetical protein ACK55I_32795 [bacterium]